MITKYITRAYSTGSLIDKVQVESETEHFVTILQGTAQRPQKEAKNGRYNVYHDTWEEAYAHLRERLKGKRKAAAAAVKHADDFEYKLKRLRLEEP